ncbi:MAG: methylenetetrahydrofolate reductase [NAD(P)H] [Verrucomicrobiota bacterium]|jgi:methylenetetrahydrofolate reductase (NADPH)|nr:methylenetetrahydrofolate reductase [NAD(P)H] [Verrucomicrobiota bacterium]MDD8051411.1 methylenetetrahydrofolate reductase [NAD(P)H] [Verrucomicrobiota bacterium]MDI9383740.1 methylenetetrahydrofolate reductase [NAD(P)H] [Verrucomicrobiota bacterium]
MHIQDVFAQHRTTTSFEFFPPRDPQAAENLLATIRQLEELKPSFVSVTYGAGGSTREMTHQLVVRIKTETALPAIPHLTCVCHTEEEIRGILVRYAEKGIDNILALGGDPPKDRMDWDRGRDGFRYAGELVAFIQKFNASGLHPNPKGFGIGVAAYAEGHPATPNRLLEMDYLKAKVDAGADYICTQLFFNNADFYDFRDRCSLAGINIPIVAGIMPVLSEKGLKRMAELAAGMRYPAPLLRAIARCNGDAEAVERVGIHWATEQCRDLLDHGVRGIHFYTLNKSDATRRIFSSLGLRDGSTL